MGSTYFSKRVHRLARHAIGGRNRSKRPKTFSSEESANKWAESQGIKKFRLVNLTNEEASKKKIRVEFD